jgi:hypothetical protein
VAQDYPDADKILVSFPEEWKFVQRIKGEETAYVASLPSSQEVPRRNHFQGLPPAVNDSLTTYTHYKLFNPWLSPILTVSWNEVAGVGRVESVDSVNIQMQTAGQAQVWQGEAAAVLWECYILGASQEVTTDHEELRQFWQAVERDIAVPHLLTLPYDPAFTDGYTDFLRQQGYKPDPLLPEWWRKVLS